MYAYNRFTGTVISLNSVMKAAFNLSNFSSHKPQLSRNALFVVPLSKLNIDTKVDALSNIFRELSSLTSCEISITLSATASTASSLDDSEKIQRIPQ
uniref:Uncharacterized protein n=1 Tax=Romanomermis culicivorax TaxID=13658 RepID=A0A915JJP2_ROMCU